MVARVMLKIFELGFNSMWTKKFQLYNLDLQKAEGSEIKLPPIVDHRKRKGIKKKNSTSASFDRVVHLKTGKFIKRCEY